MDTRWAERLGQVLTKLKADNVIRHSQSRTPDPSRPLYYRIHGEEGRAYTVFASNDYLGLAAHPEIRAVAAETAAKYGMGPRSSSVIVGYTHLHATLESKLSELTQKACSLLFPTGYAANSSLLQALSEFGDVSIFSDALNHASIIDGCRLAARNGADVQVYRHGDLAHLEELLAKCRRKRKLVVTETLFSMDGDFADLKGVAALKARYGFLFIVDEAHAMLVAGDHGGGVSERDHVQSEVDIVVGTLSKAFGCVGGFVCCARRLRPFLVSRCRSQFFSTSLPMPIVAAAIKAIEVAQRETWRRKHLLQLIERLTTALGVNSQSWIVPVVVGSAEKAMWLNASLKRVGIFVPAIRPPTVPPGTCRLRISLSAAHTFKELDILIRSLNRLK